jgi:hypothetical protein
MSKCYPIDRLLQMRRNAKSSCGLRHNSSQGSIEDRIYVFFEVGIYVFFMHPAGMFMRSAGKAAVNKKSAFTMNSMARQAFRIYIPLS